MFPRFSFCMKSLPWCRFCLLLQLSTILIGYPPSSVSGNGPAKVCRSLATTFEKRAGLAERLRLERSLSGSSDGGTEARKAPGSLSSTLTSKVISSGGFADFGVRFATAYAITKALIPLRVALSLWATPWFARVFVIRFTSRIKGLFTRLTGSKSGVNKPLSPPVSGSPSSAAAGTGAVGGRVIPTQAPGKGH